MEFEGTVKELLQVATGREDASDWSADTELLGNIAELDSMAIVTFFTVLEENYGVFVEDDEVSAETFESVATLVEFVATKLS
ncbi:MAG: phosphopantetheine-binding protein [Motiliproteus sp.]|nr:phosphopantetheine-binding protein [Motiliproteus sp.]MCW9053171.1 phosphopantetheine-binding protein [Motiliproteus sp.]